MKLQGFSVAGKAWVGLIGSLLTFIVPWAVQASTELPAPWPSVIAAGVAALTAVGIYHAPYQPAPPRNATASGPPENPWPA